jgi:hypothetical protein
MARLHGYKSRIKIKWPFPHKFNLDINDPTEASSDQLKNSDVDPWPIQTGSPAERPPAGHCPLMNLPVEIRVMVAGYALHNEDEIWWRWAEAERKPRSFVGSFRTSFNKNPNPLALTCRQLNQETRSLHLKVNNLNFDDYPHGGNSCYAVPSFAFFLEHASEEMIKAVRTVDLITLSLPRYEKELRVINHLIEDKLNITIRVEARWWSVYNSIDWPEDDISRFMEIGHNPSPEFSELVSNGKKRPWKVYPSIHSDMQIRRFRKQLSAEELALAKQWIENGI